MNKRVVNAKNREFIYSEAEKLYVYDLLTIEETAKKAKVSPRTVSNWKEKGDWDTKRAAFLKSKQAFHKDLYEFARKLMDDMIANIDNKEDISSAKSSLFCRMLPLIVKIKEYEDVVNKHDEKTEKKGLSPEILRTIEEEILGIKRNVK